MTAEGAIPFLVKFIIGVNTELNIPNTFISIKSNVDWAWSIEGTFSCFGTHDSGNSVDLTYSSGGANDPRLRELKVTLNSGTIPTGQLTIQCTNANPGDISIDSTKSNLAPIFSATTRTFSLFRSDDQFLLADQVGFDVTASTDSATELTFVQPADPVSPASGMYSLSIGITSALSRVGDFILLESSTSGFWKQQGELTCFVMKDSVNFADKFNLFVTSSTDQNSLDLLKITVVDVTSTIQGTFQFTCNSNAVPAAYPLHPKFELVSTKDTAILQNQNAWDDSANAVKCSSISDSAALFCDAGNGFISATTTTECLNSVCSKMQGDQSVCCNAPCYSGTPGAASCDATAGCGGIICDDGNAATQTDVCTEGSTTCAGNVCYSGTPDAASCSAVAGCGGTTCDDGNAATHTDVCTEGSTTCAGSACYTGTPGTASCSATAGCGGTICDDVDSAGHAHVCVEGSTTCSACYIGTPGAASCSATAGCGGTTCDDANAATHTDVCTEGSTTCAGSVCYLGTPGAASCSAFAGCGSTTCDDGNTDTNTDVCTEDSTTCAGQSGTGSGDSSPPSTSGGTGNTGTSAGTGSTSGTTASTSGTGSTSTSGTSGTSSGAGTEAGTGSGSSPSKTAPTTTTTTPATPDVEKTAPSAKLNGASKLFLFKWNTMAAAIAVIYSIAILHL